jgi:hypothetical protein
MPERRQKDARKTTERCQKDDRKMPERRQKDARKTTERCQKDARKMLEKRWIRDGLLSKTMDRWRGRCTVQEDDVLKETVRKTSTC